ncbi:hypothetical protein BDV96DRAFT_490224 [Lophiotrema nucula]|uniref:Domain of unknown function at the cortex 1 domain-containing protein n=1 Tax=Lophiotrema nucula TaxID=690887 RepID=A0A6A5ZCZ7_9PLEO|nr:hypothetical protein BDV96DRAFT_490224 [Lophiotrema nucula]
MPRSESQGPVDPASRDKYLLQIENDLMTCWLKVRIRDYNGLPRGSPSSNNYFDHPTHTSDRYSIGFSFVPKNDIPGKDLVTGFDFDHSIKDRLPPGFRYAMKIVTTILDPGIYSDPYSDKPYLYGPALSSFFAFRIGEHTREIPTEEQLKTQLEQDAAGVIEEGADGSGQRIRADQSIPAKYNKRRKNFLTPSNLENFTFEAGRLYQADFFNPYLDFANFALRIPGFSISVVKYIDDKTHQLRFVLKNRGTEEVLFVVIFSLLFGQKLEETLGDERSQLQERNPDELKTAPNDAVQTSDIEDRVSRPQTSSSNESPMPSSRSSSQPASDSEEALGQRSAAGTLASSIYSGFAALGFGRTASSSEASSATASKENSPERSRKRLNERIDDMDAGHVEELLRGRQSTT